MKRKRNKLKRNAKKLIRFAAHHLDVGRGTDSTESLAWALVRKLDILDIIERTQPYNRLIAISNEIIRKFPEIACKVGKSNRGLQWGSKANSHRKSLDKNQEKKLKEFYSSWEWSRLRYDYLKDRQRRCECCGATPESGVRVVVDHIKPIRRYWSLRLNRDNLQLLCDPCNMGKGSRDETDWQPAPTIIAAEEDFRLNAIREQLGELDG